MKSLPPAQRLALALQMDGFEAAEIAEITGQNPNTVRSNLRHARQKLIRKLDPELIPKEVSHGS
jgi:DNA-directed RNA polymerase specialized sigma24 family protein